MKTFDIQKEILRKLLGAMTLRYRDMRPSDVENDLYNYHLQFLVQKGFVKKSPGGYSLSDKGIRLVADEKPLDPLGNFADLFKVNVVTVVYRKNNSGQIEVLMQKRKRHPSMGHTIVVGSAIKKGELWQEASVSSLKREAGLEISNPLLVGFARRIVKNGAGDVVMDSIFYLVKTNEFDGNVVEQTEYGQNMWMPLDSAVAAQLEHKDNLSSVAVVMKNLETSAQPIFYSEEEKTI